jgi:hypothetical protein
MLIVTLFFLAACAACIVAGVRGFRAGQRGRAAFVSGMALIMGAVGLLCAVGLYRSHSLVDWIRLPVLCSKYAGGCGSQ